jgi:hypothetical protein
MPALSIYFIRTALINLAVGFTFGMLMLWNKGLPIHPSIWKLLPGHIELLLLGWTLQLAFGVAFWILPRFRTERGEVRLAWLAYFLLNAGVWMVTLAPILPAPGGVTLAGRVAEVCATAAFALHAWPRIKPPGVLAQG